MLSISARPRLSSLGLKRTEDLHEVRHQREQLSGVRAAQERETITLTLLADWLGTPGLTLLSPVLGAAGQNMALLVSPASACLHLPGHPSAFSSLERRDISLIVITPHHSLQTISLPSPGPSPSACWV